MRKKNTVFDQKQTEISFIKTFLSSKQNIQPMKQRNEKKRRLFYFITGFTNPPFTKDSTVSLTLSSTLL